MNSQFPIANSKTATPVFARRRQISAGLNSALGEHFGHRFRGPIRVGANSSHVLPTIIGDAYVTGETRLILDENDPLRFGVRLN